MCVHRLSLFAFVACASVGVDAVDLTGQVIRYGMDDFDNGIHYAFIEIDLGNGTTYSVVVNSETEHLQTGNHVQIRLKPWNTSSGQELEANTMPVPLFANSESWWQADGSVVQTGANEQERTGDRSILCLMVCLRSTCPSYTSHDQLREAMKGVDAITRQSSYNITGFPAASVKVATVTVDHDLKSYTSCDVRRVWTAAKAVAVEQHKSDPSFPHPSDFRHISYFIPREIPGCAFGGIGTVGGGFSLNRWDSVGLISHELGHNIGMWHAASDWNDDGSQDSEYGDDSSYMGYANGVAAVNAPQRNKMGWIPETEKVEMPDCSAGDQWEVTLRDLDTLESSGAPGSKLIATIPRSTDIGGGSYTVSYRSLASHQRRRSGSTFHDKISVHHGRRRSNTQVAAFLDQDSCYPSTSARCNSSSWQGLSSTGAPFYLTVANRNNVSAVLRVTCGSACSSKYCTSSDGKGGFHCWAGSLHQPCTCSKGKAKTTGKTAMHNGTSFYEYTCCTDGTGTGSECGDYKEPKLLYISTGSKAENPKFGARASLVEPKEGEVFSDENDMISKIRRRLLAQSAHGGQIVRGSQSRIFYYKNLPDRLSDMVLSRNLKDHDVFWKESYLNDLVHDQSYELNPCKWVAHKGMYSAGYAGGVSTEFRLPEEAQKKCIELGHSVCKAVTCHTLFKYCTVRRSPTLRVFAAETTYVPSPECYKVPPTTTTTTRMAPPTTSTANTATTTTNTHVVTTIREAGGKGCLKSMGGGKLLQSGATSGCARFMISGREFRSMDVNGQCLDNFRGRGWGLWKCYSGHNQQLQQHGPKWCIGDMCVEAASDTGGTTTSTTTATATITSTTTAKAATTTKTKGPTTSTTTSAARPTTAPEGLYYAMSEGTCCCPEEGRILTKQECNKAHDTLGLRSGLPWTGSTGIIPGGCSTRQSYSHNLHWNRQEPGSARSDITPLCKKLPTTVTTTMTSTLTTTTFVETTTTSTPVPTPVPTPAPTPQPTPATTVSPMGINSGDTVFLKTRAGLGNHIDVEGVAVRARWQSQGNFQALTIEKHGGGRVNSGDVVYLKAHTGACVDVFDGIVQARWADTGAWQAMVIEKKTGSGAILPDDIVCLKSHAGKHLDVSEDVVRARWDDCGDWQAMKIEQEVVGALFSGDQISLLAHTGNRVEAEGTYIGARWSESGLWQTFAIESYGGRAIFSGDAVFLRAHTGALLHVQDTSVAAQWYEYGAWQTFYVDGKKGKGPVMPGDRISLRSHTGRRIDVEGQAVQCRWFEAGDWQTFIVEKSVIQRRRLAEASRNDESSRQKQDKYSNLVVV